MLVSTLVVPECILHFSLQLRGHGGGNAQMELVAMFPETGSGAGQATLNSSVGFIVSEEDRVRPRSSPQHENFVSVRHGADTMSTDKSLSHFSKENPAGIRGHMFGGHPCDLTCILIDFLECVSGEGGPCLVTVGKGQATYPYPMWRGAVRECATKEEERH